VRATRVLSAFLAKWEREGLDEYGGRYCGYTTIEGVNSAMERLRPHIGMPDLTPYSFRHKGASVIRKARAGEDQVALQLGHRRKDLARHGRLRRVRSGLSGAGREGARRMGAEAAPGLITPP
jgi:integrase